MQPLKLIAAKAVHQLSEKMAPFQGFDENRAGRLNP
jgi:hypothetical protein